MTQSTFRAQVIVSAALLWLVAAPISAQTPTADPAPTALPGSSASDPAPSPITPASPTTPEPTPAAEPAPAPSPAHPGPAIELAPDAEAATNSPPAAAANGEQKRQHDDAQQALYGLKDARLARADSSTSIGGYGELHYILDSLTGPGESRAQIDLHRMVIFVAHRFSQKVRFYTEVEVEHAITGANKLGEVDVEQAYVDWQFAGNALGLRAGMIVLPMGIINQWHEPPIFHGVERPDVDRVIIPSTWHEGGIGVFGEPVEGLRYELYLVGGLDPTGFSADQGLRGGRQAVSQARADGLALSARVEVEPVLGLVAGLSGYAGPSGPNADLFDAAGAPLDLAVPVIGGAADVRGRYAGFEARAVITMFGIGDTAQLRQAYDGDGNALDLDLGSRMWGTYGEVAYDVLHSLHGEQALLPFVRVERYDTMAAISGREPTAADDAYGISELVLGLTYKPLAQVAFKSDFALASPDGPTKSQGRLELGLGLMF